MPSARAATPPSARFTLAEIRSDDSRSEVAVGEATRACWFTVKVRHGRRRRVSTFWIAVHLGRDGIPDVTLQLPTDLTGMRVHVHQGGGCVRCIEPSGETREE